MLSVSKLLPNIFPSFCSVIVLNNILAKYKWYCIRVTFHNLMLPVSENSNTLFYAKRYFTIHAKSTFNYPVVNTKYLTRLLCIVIFVSRTKLSMFYILSWKPNHITLKELSLNKPTNLLYYFRNSQISTIMAKVTFQFYDISYLIYVIFKFYMGDSLVKIDILWMDIIILVKHICMP